MLKLTMVATLDTVVIPTLKKSPKINRRHVWTADGEELSNDLKGRSDETWKLNLSCNPLVTSDPHLSLLVGTILASVVNHHDYHHYNSPGSNHRQNGGQTAKESGRRHSQEQGCVKAAQERLIRCKGPTYGSIVCFSL